MEIQHKEGGSRGKFFIEAEGKRVAAIVYEINNDTLVIEHTEVDPSLRGKNIGRQLVQQVVDEARKENKKVSPVCPFAKALFEKVPDWQDVLA